jgi:hypothetical protein
VESFSDDGRYVVAEHSHRYVSPSLLLLNDYILTTRPRRSQPRAIEYYEEPRRSTTRARSVSRRRVSDVELRPGRSSYVDPRGSGYVNEHVTKRSVSRVRH